MIHFYGLECGRKFQVKDEFGGRSTRCSTCKSPLQVPLPDRTEASAPIAQLVVMDGATAAGQRVGALASATVAYHSDGDLPVAAALAKDGQARGRYLIDKEIARGGMGAVLRGIDRDIRREIAVKVMLSDRDPGKKARFVEEAQITGQLEHPNIVPVHELGLDEQQRPFFTMKLVKGCSLDDILKRLAGDPSAEQEWPLGRLLTILVNVCHALGYAHSRGIIHRDLKPANVMVGDFGEVYVMDWGLAKVLGDPQPAPPPAPLIVATPITAKYLAKPLPAPESPTSVSDSGRVSTSRQEEADLTQDGLILGTPAYMAPEQALGRIQVRSDSSLDRSNEIYGPSSAPTPKPATEQMNCFSKAADASAIDDACRRSSVGKQLPDDLYIHRSALDLLEPLLRIYEGCGRAYLGDVDGANIIKIHRWSGKLSYLVYPDFEDDPHPALLRSVRVNLRSRQIDCNDYSQSTNPPILHRKESFLGTDHPLREKFARLTAQEEKHGLLDNASTIGTREGWGRRLAERGFTLKGHRVVKTRCTPNNPGDALR